MQEYTAIVARNLRARRRELNMTQRELAERLGYSEKSVSKWESGAGLVPSGLLPQVAAILETTIDRLFSAEGEEFYLLGIDGGGTKTELRLTDSTGRTLSSARLSSSNPVDVGITETFSVLSLGIRETLGQISPSRVSVFAGIAGLTVGDFSAQTESFLEKYGFAAYGCGSDATCAVAAGLGDADGITVIMGTGTVAFLQKDGALRRVGGYGYLLESGASGYSIGRDALAEALKFEDGIGDASLLHALLCERLSSPRLFPLISQIYASGKRGIAALAPTVFDAIDRGDATARSILRRRLAETAELITSAQKISSERGPTVLVGGLTARRDLLLPILRDLLSPDAAETLSVCLRSPIEGALYLAGKGIKSC